MNKWRLNIYNLIFLLSYKLFFVSCQEKIKDEYNQKKKDYYDYTLHSGITELKYLKDRNSRSITFTEGINDDLLINVYSPSCDIESTRNSQNATFLISSLNEISMEIKKNAYNTSDIVIYPKTFLVNGQEKYKNKRICPLIINTIEVKKFTIFVKEKEPNLLFFYKKLKKVILLYNITELRGKSGATLSFSFREVTKFNINIPDIINTNISNSITIFLDSDSLSKIKENILNITITHIEDKKCSLIFQIIEPNSIYALQKNYLNKGFITSNYLYQYYYMQVLVEEGEVMLHNKRNTGKLFGVIKQFIDPYNISEYPKDEKDNQLEFNEHTQKLSFTSENTYFCNKGCYLLITYYNENYNTNKPIINYEYSLYARIWDVDDEASQIINIPTDEFIFGTFVEDSFINHYYSIFIPYETKKLIIQIQSNYVEGFIGKGKKKLITSKKKSNNNLNITLNKMVIEFPIEQLRKLDFLNSEISLAFRSKNYFEKIFPFYYFRISILKDNNDSINTKYTIDNYLIYPLDSNIGNICIPEKGKDNNFYYCYFLLSNNNKEFQMNFSVSTTNQDDNYTIYFYHNDIQNKSKYTKYYLSNENDKNLQSIIFKFEFKDNKTKTILSTFNNMKDLIYPQIYSSQIFLFSSSSKMFNFSLNNGNCLLIFKHIHGRATIVLDKYPTIVSDLNFIGKPITIPNYEVKNISFYSKEEFIFYLKLENVNQKLGIREIFYDESLNELLLNTQFPIYYYIKYNNQDSLELNFRIINIEDKNTTSEIYINGYILNKTILNRRLNDEFIELKESIVGYYDKGLKNGLLKINKQFESDSQDIYLLIKIDGKHYITNSLSVEIIAMNSSLVPVNQYIMGSFKSSQNSENKIYLIRNNIIDNNDNKLIIEFSPNYEEINLNFDSSKGISYTKENQTKIIQKYIMNTNNNKKIFLNINKPKEISYGNFLFRYYFTKKNEEFGYKFNESSYTKKNYTEYGNDKAYICLEFDKFEIYFNNISVNQNLSNIREADMYNKNYSEIRLKIYGSLFKKVKKKNKFKQLFNTSALISSESSFENDTEINYKYNNKFELCFGNMSRKDFKYDLQIKINIIFSNYFFNKDSLVYSLPLDFTEEFKNKENGIFNFIKKYYIFLIIICGIIIVLIIFIILYFKLIKKTKTLEERVLSISFTKNNDETLSEYSGGKQSDSDYENAFI